LYDQVGITVSNGSQYENFISNLQIISSLKRSTLPLRSNSSIKQLDQTA